MKVRYGELSMHAPRAVVAVERLVVAQRQDSEPANHELFVRIQYGGFAAVARRARRQVGFVEFSLLNND